MSIVRESGAKVLLARGGADEFWQMVTEHYAGEEPQKWKYLAMLALRENAGWPLEQIGRVFEHHKGHVTRCLRAVKRELRAQFAVSPEWLGMGDEEVEDRGLRGEGREEASIDEVAGDRSGRSPLPHLVKGGSQALA